MHQIVKKYRDSNSEKSATIKESDEKEITRKSGKEGRSSPSYEIKFGDGVDGRVYSVQLILKKNTILLRVHSQTGFCHA